MISVNYWSDLQPTKWSKVAHEFFIIMQIEWTFWMKDVFDKINGSQAIFNMRNVGFLFFLCLFLCFKVYDFVPWKLARCFAERFMWTYISKYKVSTTSYKFIKSSNKIPWNWCRIHKISLDDLCNLCLNALQAEPTQLRLHTRFFVKSKHHDVSTKAVS